MRPWPTRGCGATGEKNIKGLAIKTYFKRNVLKTYFRLTLVSVMNV
jgi:hypothetical protein